jgi:hypothetical protein
MLRLLFAALILLPRFVLCQRPGSPPQLELKAELDAEVSQLKVSWVNEGTDPFLITVGSTIGWAGLMPNLRMSINGAGLPTGKLNDTAVPGGVAGRAELLVVCLTSRTEYCMRFATDKLWLPGYEKTLSNIRDRPWTLVVAYSGIKAFLPRPGGGRIPYDVLQHYPVEFPFWTGDIKAEVGNPRRR